MLTTIAIAIVGVGDNVFTLHSNVQKQMLANVDVASDWTNVPSQLLVKDTQRHSLATLKMYVALFLLCS